MHKTLRDPDHKGFHGVKKTMERIAKHAAFECRSAATATLRKTLVSVRWAAMPRDWPMPRAGMRSRTEPCGNEESVVCRGEQIYLAAKKEKLWNQQ